MVNTMTKSTSRAKGFCYLTKPAHTPLLSKVKTDPQAELEDCKWSRAVEGMPLSALLPITSLACFLIEPRATSSGVALPPVSWTSRIKHQSKKNVPQTCLQANLMEAFSQLRFPPRKRLQLMSGGKRNLDALPTA